MEFGFEFRVGLWMESERDILSLDLEFDCYLIFRTNDMGVEVDLISGC